MESTKILLGEDKHRLGVNENNNIGVELQSYEKVMPYTDSSYSVDAYMRYFKEKDESNKYRLAFTITSFCSNVLFNVLTEPVYKEGSDDCYAVTTARTLQTFNKYKTGTFDRHGLIMDTGFSHPKTSSTNYPIVYHCGYDIFNNHFFRKREFNVVNSGNTNSAVDGEKIFNTIKDTLRDNTGSQVQEHILQIKNGRLDNSKTNIHLYQYDTTYSYGDAILNNLVETDGWFGFKNPTTIAIDNVQINGEAFSINKCMNNNNAWEHIDMYPDRSLYSFVPKINKFRGRVEKNWDYCVTYPFASDSEHPMVYGNGVNGLKCRMDTRVDAKSLEAENSLVTFRTFTRHNLSQGGYVILFFIESGASARKTANPVKIISLGNHGSDEEHYFSVRLSSIINELADMSGNNVTRLRNNEDFDEIRFKKYESGCEAEYYIRKFKPFNDHINSLNKLSFSQNVYSDQVAQIVYTEDFDTTGVRDNLGRPLSELYLTIVKRNKGYKEWYESNTFNTDGIEFSHCFGEVTSGFNLPTDDECKDYNVRRIHSVSDDAAIERNVTKSPKKLETGITIDNEWFYGDIVEFTPSRMTEETIEDVYHRFNTAQRETLSSGYRALYYDEFDYDDYDIDHHFSIKKNSLLSNEMTHANIVPEGYYYKPHYKVLIMEFEDEVNQGNHILINYKSITNIGGGEWKLETSKNYYFEQPVVFNGEVISEGSKVYARKINDGKLSEITGTCISVSGSDFREVTIRMENGTDIKKGGYKIYRQNTEMPDGSYELKDGSGRYLWRNVLSFSDMAPDDELYEDVFTNGAHYFHKNIMFYLKRQDPLGEYGIGNEPDDMASFVSIEGKTKDVSYSEYVEEGKGSVC